MWYRRMPLDKTNRTRNLAVSLAAAYAGATLLFMLVVWVLIVPHGMPHTLP